MEVLHRGQLLVNTEVEVHQVEGNVENEEVDDDEEEDDEQEPMHYVLLTYIVGVRHTFKTQVEPEGGIHTWL